MSSEHERRCPSDEDEYDYGDDPNAERHTLPRFPEVQCDILDLSKAWKTRLALKSVYVNGEKQPRHKHIYLSLFGKVLQHRQSQAKSHNNAAEEEKLADPEQVKELCLQWCLSWARLLRAPAETSPPHPREGSLLDLAGSRLFAPPSAHYVTVGDRKLLHVRYWVAPSVGPDGVQHYNEIFVIFDAATWEEITHEFAHKHDPHINHPQTFNYLLTF